MFKRGKKPREALNLGFYRRIDNPSGLYYIISDENGHSTARWNAKDKSWQLGNFLHNHEIDKMYIKEKGQSKFPCEPDGPLLKLSEGFPGLVANTDDTWVDYKIHSEN